MRLLILIVLPLIGCMANVDTKSSIEEGKVIPESSNTQFSRFLEKFEKVDLPLELKTNSKHWINFSGGDPSSAIIR